MQYGAAHPFVFWIEAIAYVVKAQLTMLAKKNLIWYESGGQKIRPFAWILQGARPFGSGRVSFPQPVTCQPPQTCSVTGSWRRLDRLDTHGAEFFYESGFIKSPSKKRLSINFTSFVNLMRCDSWITNVIAGFCKSCSKQCFNLRVLTIMLMTSRDVFG